MSSHKKMTETFSRIPIGSMYGIYANIWGILMVNVTIYGIHGSYGIDDCNFPILQDGNHDFPGNGI
jgi:hypothetical protein